MKKIYPDTIIEEAYDKLPHGRKQYAKPFSVDNDRFAKTWQEQPYERKSFSKDASFYQTIRGDRVRSKSEMIIADRLWANGIPYKYECPLKVGKKIIHPDFTILRLSDRKVLYHEHCGMVDNQEYAEDMVERISDTLINEHFR